MPLTRNQDRQQRREDDVIPAADANANENHEEHDSPHDRPHAESRSNNSTFNLDDVSALMASLQRSQAETFKNIMSYVMEQRSSTPAPPPMPPVNVDGTLARCRASFSGAPGESVEAFIDAIESYTECVQVSDANIIRGLAMLLSADAATWWLGLKHHISTWNEAKENLIYAYGTRLPPHRIYLEIFASPQDNENTDKFVARIRALMAKLPRDDITEKVQLDMIYGLLHNRIRTRLRREEITSFNSLLNHARNIEDSIEETQSRPVSSTSGVRSIRAQPAPAASRPEPCAARASAPAPRARFSNSAAAVVPATAVPAAVAQPTVATPAAAVPGSAEQFVTTKKQRPVCSYCKRFGHVREQCRKLNNRGEQSQSNFSEGVQNDNNAFYSVQCNVNNTNTISSNLPVQNAMYDVKQHDKNNFLSNFECQNFCNRDANINYATINRGPTSRKSYFHDCNNSVSKNINCNCTSNNEMPTFCDSHVLYNQDVRTKCKNLNTCFNQGIRPKCKNSILPYNQIIEPNCNNLKFSTNHDCDTKGSKCNFGKINECVEIDNCLNFNYCTCEGSVVASVYDRESDDRYLHLRPIFKIQVLGKQGTALIDTAAKHCIAGHTLYALLLQKGHPLTPSTRRVKLADGHVRNMDVLTTILPVRLEHIVINIPFIIFPDSNDNETLLGIDFINAAKVIIDFHRHEWYFSTDAKVHYKLLFEPMSRGVCIASANMLRDDEGMHLQSAERQALSEFLIRHESIFTAGGGPTPFIEHCIDIGDHPPIAVPPYRLNPSKKETMKNEIEKMLADDIIEECESAWCSPALMIPKSNEGFQQHLQDLEAVFGRLSEFKLHVNREKCTFAKERVRYLGHVITPDGVSPDPEKVSAVLNMLEPSNLKHLKTFLQTCSWFRKFIPNFSKIAEPLTRLTKKNYTWSWGPEQTQAFKELKRLLTTAPVLVQANFKQPLVLRTDASNYALGAVLAQGEGKDERPIEYASRLLTAAERNYSTTEREALAVVWAVERFRPYLDGQPIIIGSDHQPLRWLLSLKSPAGRLVRWALKLQEFDIRFEYTPGKANVVADTLSRPICSNETQNNCGICSVICDLPTKSPTQLRQDQFTDPEIQKIVTELEGVDELAAKRWSERGFLMEQGVLYRFNPDSDAEAPQLVIPAHQVTDILKELHDAPTAGHAGIDRTYQQVSRLFYFTGMRRIITDYVKACIHCQRYKAANTKPPGLLQTPVMNQRNEVLAVDLFGPLPPGKQGERWILLIEDTATRWTELFPLKEATAEACAHVLIEEYFMRFGLPRRLVSDNGVQFISAVMRQCMSILGIKQNLIPLYHPEANPAERKNRDLKTLLAQLVECDHTSWPNMLPVIRFALNNAKCRTTGMSPAYLSFGREMRSPTEVAHDLRAVLDKDNFVPQITPYLRKFVNSFSAVRERVETLQDKAKGYADRSRRPIETFNEGDMVLIKSHVLSKSANGLTSKFVPKRDGPYRIVKKVSPTTYHVAHVDKPDEVLGKYHVNDLTLYRENQSDALPRPVMPKKKRGRPPNNVKTDSRVPGHMTTRHAEPCAEAPRLSPAAGGMVGLAPVPQPSSNEMLVQERGRPPGLEGEYVANRPVRHSRGRMPARYT
ncbi:uncharacterized protein LOC134198871 [Bombyx mori]|uniref:uncharacterized protein LOC134198871 n=1 Tax=Bombyx mori TaxID=7091 RepID=UPI002ED3BDD9